MYGSEKFRAWMRHPGCWKKDSTPPDYTPMAEASKETAEVMAKLGYEQLDFSKQQYEDAKPLFKQIVDKQMAIADETAAQGRDYYDYMKSYRPTEQAMLADANVDRSQEIADYDAANKADAATATMDPTAVYAANKGEIDTQVGQAVADSQGAYTRALNQAIRQGLRYGADVQGITGQVGQVGVAQASQQASAANTARTAGIQGVRDRATGRLQLRQGNMTALNKERAIDWAKKLDAVGLVKGMPGASQGAYGLAVSAGNSAGQNQMSPGNAMTAGYGQAAQTIGSGQQMKIQGLGNILNSQTQLAASNNDSDWASGLGSVIGAGITVF